MAAITQVWIEEGCCGCGACHATCPSVFGEPDAVAVVIGSARLDGATSQNRAEMSPLLSSCHVYGGGIAAAAAGCPVDVIRLTVG